MISIASAILEVFPESRKMSVLLKWVIITRNQLQSKLFPLTDAPKDSLFTNSLFLVS